jgi:hypothetical protein
MPGANLLGLWFSVIMIRAPVRKLADGAEDRTIDIEPLAYPLETAIPFASEKVYVSDLIRLMMEDVMMVWPGPAPRSVTPDFD